MDLSDRESEALLLILFISAAHEGPGVNMISAWRRGDSETLHRALRESFQDFPSLARRLIDVRNQNWLPKSTAIFAAAKHILSSSVQATSVDPPDFSHC